MTTDDERNFKAINKCWICSKSYLKRDNKIRDLNHIPVKYRGSAHETCNLNLRLTKRAFAIFHNLGGNDSHLILQEI